jgi:hypothetical protein
MLCYIFRFHVPPHLSFRIISIPTDSRLHTSINGANGKEIGFDVTLHHDVTRFSHSNFCLFGVHRCRCVVADKDEKEIDRSIVNAKMQ